MAEIWDAPSTSAWQNRFEAPADDQYLAHCEPNQKVLYQHTMDTVLKLGEFQLERRWMGEPWCWATCLIRPELLPAEPEVDEEGNEIDPPVWAYIVPGVETPVLAMGLEQEIIDKLPMRRIKKAVRDQITHGKTIESITWTEWPIAAKTHLADVMDLINRVYKLTSPPKDEK